jgi:PAS domain S-box-containing protein
MNEVRPAKPDVQRVPSWRGVFLVVIALLLVSGGLAVHQYIRFSSASAQIDRSHRAIGGIDELVTSLLDAETSAREFLLTGRASLLEPYTDARPRVAAATAALATLEANDPGQRTRVEQLGALSRERLAQLQSAVESHQAGRTADAISRIRSDAIDQRMDRIRLVAADMKTAEQAVLDRRDEEARLSRRVSLVFAIASFLLAGTLGLVSAAVEHSLKRRREAFEREMAGRLRAENSMLSATQELSRSERINRSILDTSGDCIQILEPDGRLISMNRAGARLLEIDDEAEFSRRPWVEVWSQSADASAALNDAVKGGEGRFQAFCATARGTPKWWDVLVTPIRDDSGYVTRLLSISRDITEQKRADEERNQLLERERQARADAEHAMQMKDEFLATLSHELRTPLNSIVGWVGVLKQDQTRETLRKAIDVIDRNSRRQAQMIDDLLDVSRIVSGKLPLEARAVNLGSVIDEVIASARTAADAKGVHLTTVYDTDPSVNGDRARLQQVVWNLVSNAIKFTGRDGIVKIALHTVADCAEIEVSDDGQGIAPDLLPHIFERFLQGDSSSTRRHGGLGLGLAIVKNLAEMHGGSVEASSAGPGRGAMFTVRLPLHRTLHDRPTELADASSRSKPLLDNVVVMVVDDEADARDLVQRLLEDAGARVSACDTAEAALQTIQDGLVPDVIVSDVAMPEQDGYDFMKRVRQMQAPMSSVPAAALTALARVADRRRALLAGFQTHLTKPVDPTELVATVANLAGRSGKSYV